MNRTTRTLLSVGVAVGLALSAAPASADPPVNRWAADAWRSMAAMVAPERMPLREP